MIGKMNKNQKSMRSQSCQQIITLEHMALSTVTKMRRVTQTAIADPGKMARAMITRLNNDQKAFQNLLVQ
jgi:hypothetical protein